MQRVRFPRTPRETALGSKSLQCSNLNVFEVDNEMVCLELWDCVVALLDMGPLTQYNLFNWCGFIRSGSAAHCQRLFLSRQQLSNRPGNLIHMLTQTTHFAVLLSSSQTPYVLIPSMSTRDPPNITLNHQRRSLTRIISANR